MSQGPATLIESGNDLVDVGGVLCCLGGFADASLCPQADIIPCNGDGTIDIGDILAVLDAFSGVYTCVWDNGV